MAAVQTSLAEQLKNVPTNVRPTVKAAIKTVKEAAPKADEIAYRSRPPRSSSAMWKLVRYSVGGANVVGVGTGWGRDAARGGGVPGRSDVGDEWPGVPRAEGGGWKKCTEGGSVLAVY